MQTKDDVIFFHDLAKKISRLNEIGIALSKETNLESLLEKILETGLMLTHADAGTIYTIEKNKAEFRTFINRSLDLHYGGTSEMAITFPAVELVTDQTANVSSLIGYAIHNKCRVNIQDAYSSEQFNFSQTKWFDQLFGYHTKSVLVVPIYNLEKEIISAIQLINPIHPVENAILSFTKEDEQIVESLASQASVALTNRSLIEGLKNLFNSFIQTIAETIDKKMPSTGKHGNRVPILCQYFLDAINTDEEKYKDLFFDEMACEQLEIAANLHDCGKLILPDATLEKKTKLWGVGDRIDLIDLRFEILRKKLKANGKDAEVDKQIEKDREMLHALNRGEIHVTEKIEERVEEISRYSWLDHRPFLNDSEKENLLVKKGNLNQKEKEVIQSHVVESRKMLEAITYPKQLARVPEIVAAHHERPDGRGYPLGLTKEQIPFESKILTICDIFEALSAPDRPYRKKQPLSEILAIMKKMSDAGEIDPELFSFFCEKKVYLRYAAQYLDPRQIDV